MKVLSHPGQSVLYCRQLDLFSSVLTNWKGVAEF